MHAILKTAALKPTELRGQIFLAWFPPAINTWRKYSMPIWTLIAYKLVAYIDEAWPELKQVHPTRIQDRVLPRPWRKPYVAHYDYELNSKQSWEILSFFGIIPSPFEYYRIKQNHKQNKK